MKILVTGNSATMSAAFFDEIGEEYEKFLNIYPSRKYNDLKHITTYGYEGNSKEYQSLFTTCNFEAVVFISKALDGARKIYDELEYLENTLYNARINGMKNFVYITTCEKFDAASKENSESRKILLDSCNEMIRHYSEEYDIDTCVIHAPYIYSAKPAENYLWKILKACAVDNAAAVAPRADAGVDFLCDADLGSLVGRVLDNPIKGFKEIYISGGNETTFEKIKSNINKVYPKAEITFKNYTHAVPAIITDNTARNEYGYIPLHFLLNDLEEMLEYTKKRYGSVRRKKRKEGKGNKAAAFIRKIVELIVLFAVAVFLNQWTAESGYFRHFDFLIAFIIISGTMNGLHFGVAAALMSCAAVVIDREDGVSLQMVFYNIYSWIPFATYIILGSATGYERDRRREELNFIQEKLDMIRKKYVYLTELYDQSLKNKEEYVRQIVGYEDSYGKIASTVKKLDSTVREQIFYEAVNSLEDVLDNKTVCIYSITDASGYARLMACSSTQYMSISKSTNLNKFPKLLLDFDKHETYVNKENLTDYPDYAYPIINGDNISGVIVLRHVGYEQMNSEYMNKFKIICDLIKDALNRAYSYNKSAEREIMMEGLNIYKSEKFEEIIAAEQKLHEESLSDYKLLKVDYKDISLNELQETILQSVRVNDELGMRNDGNIYLILRQAREEDLGIVLDRIKSTDITLTPVN